MAFYEKQNKVFSTEEDTWELGCTDVCITGKLELQVNDDRKQKQTDKSPISPATF